MNLASINQPGFWSYLLERTKRFQDGLAVSDDGTLRYPVGNEPKGLIKSVKNVYQYNRQKILCCFWVYMHNMGRDRIYHTTLLWIHLRTI
jgi:hypothetical protein